MAQFILNSIPNVSIKWLFLPIHCKLVNDKYMCVQVILVVDVRYMVLQKVHVHHATHIEF